MGSIIKDARFQQGTSFAILTVFVFYTIVDASLDYATLAETYPQSTTTWAKHCAWFVWLVAKIYMDTIVGVGFAFLAMFLVLFLVMVVIKFDPDVFRQISRGVKTDALVTMSELYDRDSDVTLTPRDLVFLMFSFVFRHRALVIGTVFLTLLFALAFSIVIVSPAQMTTPKNCVVNTRLFLTAFTMFWLLLVVMYTCVTHL